MFLKIMQDFIPSAVNPGYIAGNCVGWLLMFFNFGIVLMWKSVRSDTKVVHAIWFCILLHHVVAFLNAYVGGVIGTEGDARGLHFFGLKAALSELEVGYFAWEKVGEDLEGLTALGGSLSNPRICYTNSLALLYRAFGASFLFGNELSVLAFTLSCVVLVKLVDLLDLWRFRVGIILFFGLLPSSVIFRSVTLRESWQALFFLLSVYWAIRLWKRPGILTVSFMLMSAFCMAVLHNGLKVYAIYLVLFSIYWGIFSRKKSAHLPRSARFLFAGVLAACIFVFTQKMEIFMTVGEGLVSIEAFRQDATTIHARSNYGDILDTSSVYGLVTTIPMVFTQYMFAPFPWQVENAKDVYAFLESMLRFALLFFAVFFWRRSSGEVRSYSGFLLIVVLCMELIWALGTINWGTATRHHVPGYSVIVLLGAPGLILFMQSLHFEMFGRRKDNTMLPK